MILAPATMSPKDGIIGSIAKCGGTANSDLDRWTLNIKEYMQSMHEAWGSVHCWIVFPNFTVFGLRQRLGLEYKADVGFNEKIKVMFA